MDFTTFIDSRDIAAHLKDMNYAFTAPEASFVVYSSTNATLAERFAAWEHIIDAMPDCSMGERFNMEAIPSLHGFLRRYMDLQQKYVERFRRPGGQALLASFLFRGFGDDYAWSDDTAVCFSDLDSCLAYMMRKEADYGEQELRALRVLRLPMDGCRGSAADSMVLDRKGDILSLDIYDQTDEELVIDSAFEGMWFGFPTPFQRGDILIQRGRCRDVPFVLNELSAWDTRTCREQGVRERWAAGADKRVSVLAKRGDISDMSASGFYLTETGALDCSSVFGYLSFERPRAPLKGEERLLKPLSCLIKKEIGPVEFLDAYRLIAAEERLRRDRPDRWYTDTFFEMVGSEREK